MIDILCKLSFEWLDSKTLMVKNRNTTVSHSKIFFGQEMVQE